MKNKTVRQFLTPINMAKRNLEMLSDKELCKVMRGNGIYTSSTIERAGQAYRDRKLNGSVY